MAPPYEGDSNSTGLPGLKPIFYSERHSFLGRSSPGAAWRAIEVLGSQKCSAIFPAKFS